jgi:CheY-like chemotaxis protein
MHVAQPDFPRSASAEWLFLPTQATLVGLDRGGGSAAIAKQRILLVEDEYFIAAQMEQWLIEAGHEVVAIVSSAEAAIDLAERSLPDLIIMDIRLAGSEDGVYAAKQIYTSQGIRSIFSTAHSDDWTRLQAAPAQPLGWLEKPYGREEFLQALAQAATKLQEDS